MADVASCCRGVCCAVLECAGRRGRAISLRNIRLKAVFTKLIQSQEQILIQTGGNKYTADSLCAHMGVNREICIYAYISISVCMCLWLRAEWKRGNTNAIEFILKWPKQGEQKERCLVLSLSLSLPFSRCLAATKTFGLGLARGSNSNVARGVCAICTGCLLCNAELG